MKHDPRTTAELISACLVGDEDDEVAWAAIWALHGRGTLEVLDAARKLAASASPRERGRAADILGQLGIPKRTFPTECGDLLMDLLRREADPALLSSVASALGHLQEPRAVPGLVKLAQHPSEDVRFAVVLGLSGQGAPEAIEALIALSRDSDLEIRNWATFALGSQVEEFDSPVLREALAARLSDDDPEVRGEAIVGLAKRHDSRARGAILRELAASSVMVLVIEAAEALGDATLLPDLRALRESPGKANTYSRKTLDDAIATLEGNP